MSTELHSSYCDNCEENEHKYTIHYKQVINNESITDNEFYYDEDKNIHYHIKNTSHHYLCYCSNGHTWYEYPINKCPSCSWQSSDVFYKWKQSTTSDNDNVINFDNDEIYDDFYAIYLFVCILLNECN